MPDATVETPTKPTTLKTTTSESYSVPFLEKGLMITAADVSALFGYMYSLREAKTAHPWGVVLQREGRAWWLAASTYYRDSCYQHSSHHYLHQRDRHPVLQTRSHYWPNRRTDVHQSSTIGCPSISDGDCRPWRGRCCDGLDQRGRGLYQPPDWSAIGNHSDRPCRDLLVFHADDDVDTCSWSAEPIHETLSSI